MPRSNETRASQWLSLCSGAGESKLLSPRTAATEARVPWSLCCATREVTATRSLLVTTRETPEEQWRPSTAKNKWIKKNFFFFKAVFDFRILQMAARVSNTVSPNSCPSRTSDIHWKAWCWSSNTLTTWCEELTHWKRSWCWERLKAKGEGHSWGWDG